MQYERSRLLTQLLSCPTSAHSSHPRVAALFRHIATKTSSERRQMAESIMSQAKSTSLVPVSPWKLGRFKRGAVESDLPLEDWSLELADTPDARRLAAAARQIQQSSVPVAFPTETVYGLGADATRSEAVKGIYKAKNRPADNPLIVHIASLKQLRALLHGSASSVDHQADPSKPDPIPEIYKPLIEKFWPGPLTILLPVPDPSPLAPETTAGLQTFGARMPHSILALALIKLADRPIAAPSANASTKPSPTAAEHVMHDLEGRIETIIDGGPCSVGVESTVVDGLMDPPVVLRPGGVSIGELREVPGWDEVRIAYEDQAEGKGKVEGDGPRAPGMKYRHYSPKARVILFDAGRRLDEGDVRAALGPRRRVGVVRTKHWARMGEVSQSELPVDDQDPGRRVMNGHAIDTTATGLVDLPAESPLAQMLREHSSSEELRLTETPLADRKDHFTILDVRIGPDTGDIARGLFSALRDLDRKEVDVILVEGIPDGDGDDVSAAVMNRLRKAAEVNVH